MPKKKHYTPDNWDDQEVPSGFAAGTAADPEVAKITLRDFIVPQKVSAFAQAYNPAPDTLDDTSPYVEAFDDSRLREFFKAYVCGLGDPLALYVEDLVMLGFRMRVSLATGEPCIFVIRK